MYYIRGVLKHLTKLKGKHLCPISFSIKLLIPGTLLKRDSGTIFFPVNFVKCFKTFFPQQIRTTASENIAMISNDKSSHCACSVRKGVLRNFGKFSGKHLYQSLFLNKVEGLNLQLFKKEILSLEHLFKENLRASASALTYKKITKKNLIILKKYVLISSQVINSFMTEAVII